MNEKMNDIRQQPGEDICLSTLLYGGKITSELSDDFILPDYLPDVRQIVKCYATPVLKGNYITSGRLDTEGEVLYNILYISDGNLLKSASFITGFENGIAIEGIGETCSVCLNPVIGNLSCRTINPRKFAVKTRVDIHTEVRCRECIAPTIVGEKVSKTDLEYKTGEVEGAVYSCLWDHEGEIFESIEVEPSLPQIKDIIWCDVTYGVQDVRMEDDLLSIKGDMMVDCLYSVWTEGEGEGERYQMLNKRIPFTREIAFPEISAEGEYLVRIYPDSVKTEVQSNSYGENRIIELETSYKIGLLCVENQKNSVIHDMYVVDCPSEVSYQNVEVPFVVKPMKTNYSINESLSKSDISADLAQDIVFSDADFSIRDIKNEKGRLTLSGEADITFVSTSGGVLKVHTAKIPLKFDLDGSGVPEKFDWMSQKTVSDVRVRLDPNKAYFDFELAMNLLLFGNETVHVVKSISVDKTPSVSPDAFNLRLYYPQEEDDVWTICKKYRIRQKDFISENSITDGNVKGKHVVLIPDSMTH